MTVNIGIDMGGTRIKTGLVRDGVLVDSTKIRASSHVTLEERLPVITEEINRLLKVHRVTPSGVGLAFPGIVDSDRKEILSKYVKYADAQSVDLVGWAHKEWGVPFAIENDARAALVGEWQYGAGRHCDNLVLITLGTGVGTAAMMYGKLLKGKNYLAGNLGGHMSVNLHGRECNCGNTGCVESEASTWALQKYISEEPGFHSSALASVAGIGFENIFQSALAGDALAIRIKDNCLKAWSLGIINLICAYDPERVVIGGGIMQSKDLIIPFIKEMILKDSWIRDNSIELVAAEQIESAGILGMSWLVSTLNA